MKKKILWTILIILIILLIGITTLYILNKDSKNTETKDDHHDEKNIAIIYGLEYLKTEIYENSNLTSTENDENIEVVNFSGDTVYFCSKAKGLECYSNKYVLEDTKLIIYGADGDILYGEFEFSNNEDLVTLTQTSEDGTKSIYYFQQIKEETEEEAES